MPAKQETKTEPENGRAMTKADRDVEARAAAIRAAYPWWELALAGAVALIVGLGTLQIVPFIAHPVALLILAICIAAAMAPLVQELERFVPRLAAILIIYLIVLLVFIGIGQAIIPAIVTQAKKIGTGAPDLMSLVQDRLNSFGLAGSGLATPLAGQLGQFSSALVGLPLMLLSSVLEIFLVLVMSIYWLIVAYQSRDFFLSLFPESSHWQIRTILQEIGNSMGGFIRATVINGVVIGTLTAVGLTLIGVDFPLVLGLLAGLFELVPIVGPIISGILVVAVAFLNSPTQAIIALVFMFLLQQLEGNVLVPNIMRSQTEMSPLVVILALFAGNTIGGLLGALIAIPIASAIQVLIRRLAVPAIREHSGVVEEEEEAPG